MPGVAKTCASTRRPSRARAYATAAPITPAPMTAIEPCSRIRLPYTISNPANSHDPRESIMPAALACPWAGVFPAVTTQFNAAGDVDLAATQAVQAALVRDGVHGLVLLGTVGENNSLSAEEKRAVLTAAVKTVRGRVPLITGVSEYTTAGAAAYARDAQRIGVDGLMVLPEQHFRSVAQATVLPIMLYNNPPAYRVNIELATLARLADVPNIVAIKESAPDPRRFTDVINQFAERFVLFAGLDDIALEGLLVGAKGWVSGLANAFPAESLALYAAIRAGDLTRARTIYRWFMPLLHLDAEHDLVQYIKLAEEIMGRGSERVRPPRLPLAGARRAEVIAVVERARATRPRLS
jgi:dihydrodipicolinate synthase/N-acetylneuraminate lyase